MSFSTGKASGLSGRAAPRGKESGGVGRCGGGQSGWVPACVRETGVPTETSDCASRPLLGPQRAGQRPPGPREPLPSMAAPRGRCHKTTVTTAESTSAVSRVPESIWWPHRNGRKPGPATRAQAVGEGGWGWGGAVGGRGSGHPATDPVGGCTAPAPDQRVLPAPPAPRGRAWAPTSLGGSAEGACWAGLGGGPGPPGSAGARGVETEEHSQNFQGHRD